MAEVLRLGDPDPDTRVYAVRMHSRSMTEEEVMVCGRGRDLEGAVQGLHGMELVGPRVQHPRMIDNVSVKQSNAPAENECALDRPPCALCPTCGGGSAGYGVGRATRAVG